MLRALYQCDAWAIAPWDVFSMDPDLRRDDTVGETRRRAKEQGPARGKRAPVIAAVGRTYFGSRTLLTTWMTPFDWLTSVMVMRPMSPLSETM